MKVPLAANGPSSSSSPPAQRSYILIIGKYFDTVKKFTVICIWKVCEKSQRQLFQKIIKNTSRANFQNVTTVTSIFVFDFNNFFRIFKIKGLMGPLSYNRAQGRNLSPKVDVFK